MSQRLTSKSDMWFLSALYLSKFAAGMRAEKSDAFPPFIVITNTHTHIDALSLSHLLNISSSFQWSQLAQVTEKEKGGWRDDGESESWRDAQKESGWEQEFMWWNSASVVHLQLCHVFFSLFSSYSSPRNAVCASVIWQQHDMQITGGRWDGEF